jgi:hypothetical protein
VTLAGVRCPRCHTGRVSVDPVGPCPGCDDARAGLAAAYELVESHIRQRCGEHVDVHLRRGRVVVDGREIGEGSTLIAAVDALGRVP